MEWRPLRPPTVRRRAGRRPVDRLSYPKDKTFQRRCIAFLPGRPRRRIAGVNPSSSQAKEMADESMVRNLAAQAEAIWPQEEPIFDRHPLGDSAVLDVGCGTGEITG